MRRFVVIATLRRGAVRPAEALDADQQEAAFQRWLSDEPRRFDARAVKFAPEDDCRVEWKPRAAGAARRLPRIERMMQLAERLR